MPVSVVYTTADHSAQSGAVRSLVRLVKGDWCQGGFVTAGYLNAPLQGASLLEGIEGRHLAFGHLPSLSRSLGWRQRCMLPSRIVHGARELATFVRRNEIQIIHANEILDIYAGLAAKWVGARCVWHVRSDLSSPPWLRILLSNLCFGLADQVVCVSQSVRRSMFPNWKDGKDRIVVLHNPLPDQADFHPKPAAPHVLAGLGIPAGAPVVTLVAKLSWRKGHDVFLRALPTVRESFPKVRFVLVGGELEGQRHQAYLSRIRSLPRELGVEGAVVWAGFRSDVADLMAASDVIVHCSRFPDPFPGVVLEGMCLERPIVAAGLGGPIEQIEHEVDGVLIPPDDPETLASVLVRLIGDPLLRRRLGQAARRKVLSEFSEETFRRGLEAIYRRAAGPGC